MKIRNVLGILAVTGAVYLGKTCIDRNFSENYLSREDFESMQWCRVQNSDGILWDNYMRTDNIPKNQINWASYIEEVKKRNPGKRLEGRILVPCETKSSQAIDNSRTK